MKSKMKKPLLSALAVSAVVAGADLVPSAAHAQVHAGIFLDGKDDSTIAGLAAAVPLERLGRPEDVAETVAFLAGPARWVNGQVLFVNGGLA